MVGNNKRDGGGDGPKWVQPHCRKGNRGLSQSCTHTLPQTTDGAREQAARGKKCLQHHPATWPHSPGGRVRRRGYSSGVRKLSVRQSIMPQAGLGLWGNGKQRFGPLICPHLAILPLTAQVGGIYIGDAAARWTPSSSANQRMALFTHSDTQSQCGHQESLHKPWVSSFNPAFLWGNGHFIFSTVASLTLSAQLHKEDRTHWRSTLCGLGLGSPATSQTTLTPRRGLSVPAPLPDLQGGPPFPAPPHGVVGTGQLARKRWGRVHLEG